LNYDAFAKTPFQVAVLTKSVSNVLFHLNMSGNSNNDDIGSNDADGISNNRRSRTASTAADQITVSNTDLTIAQLITLKGSQNPVLTSLTSVSVDGLYFGSLMRARDLIVAANGNSANDTCGACGVVEGLSENAVVYCMIDAAISNPFEAVVVTGMRSQCTPPTADEVLVRLGLMDPPAVAASKSLIALDDLTVQLILACAVVVLVMALLGALITVQANKAHEAKAKFHHAVNSENHLRGLPTDDNFEAFETHEELASHRRASMRASMMFEADDFNNPAHFYPEMGVNQPDNEALRRQRSASINLFGEQSADGAAFLDAMAKAAAVFEVFDADSNGTLSVDEMAALIKYMDKDATESAQNVAGGTSALNLASFGTDAVLEMMELPAQEGISVDLEISQEVFVDVACKPGGGFLATLVEQVNLDKLRGQSIADILGDEVLAKSMLQADEHTSNKQPQHQQQRMPSSATGTSGDSMQDKAMAIFMLFDVDRSTTLDRPEVRQMIIAMIEAIADRQKEAEAAGKTPTLDWRDLNAKAVFAIVFPAYQPEVTCDEFGALFKGKRNPLYSLVEAVELEGLHVGASKAKASAIFKMFDADNNRNLSVEELASMAAAMANADSGSLISKELLQLDKSLVAEIMRLEFDADGDGVVTEAEFLRICCRAWCAFFGRNLHSRMPLDPTHDRLKRTRV
jgi:Ca2+-binding EF-hand superfamily protein